MQVAHHVLTKRGGASRFTRRWGVKEAHNRQVGLAKGWGGGGAQGNRGALPTVDKLTTWVLTPYMQETTLVC